MSTHAPPGRVLLFTGDGKGKTTAALGLGLRALGRGLRVCVVQFIKSRRDTGEIQAAAAFGNRFEILPAGRGFVKGQGGEPEDRALARAALELARHKMHECDLLVLDEVNCAVKAGLLEVDDVLALLRQKPAALHVVLTGRDALPQLVAAADTATDMRNLKHAYDNGSQAMPGVEC